MKEGREREHLLNLCHLAPLEKTPMYFAVPEAPGVSGHVVLVVAIVFINGAG
jgi:hypothetical protein